MERARTLLEITSLPIGAVADAVGFGNQVYFATRVKRQTGLSPGEWRLRTRTPRAGARMVIPSPPRP
jgi:AraC-like DNA-binding protein